MVAFSRDWRTAELQVEKNLHPAHIIEMYAGVVGQPSVKHLLRSVSFSRMIETIVDAEEATAFEEMATK